MNCHRQQGSSRPPEEDFSRCRCTPDVRDAPTELALEAAGIGDCHAAGDAGSPCGDLLQPGFDASAAPVDRKGSCHRQHGPRHRRRGRCERRLGVTCGPQIVEPGPFSVKCSVYARRGLVGRPNTRISKPASTPLTVRSMRETPEGPKAPLPFAVTLPHGAERCSEGTSARRVVKS